MIGVRLLRFERLGELRPQLVAPGNRGWSWDQLRQAISRVTLPALCKFHSCFSGVIKIIFKHQIAADKQWCLIDFQGSDKKPLPEAGHIWYQKKTSLINSLCSFNRVELQRDWLQGKWGVGARGCILLWYSASTTKCCLAFWDKNFCSGYDRCAAVDGVELNRLLPRRRDTCGREAL